MVLEKIMDALRPSTGKIVVNPIITVLALVLISILIFSVEVKFLVVIIAFLFILEIFLVKVRELTGHLLIIGAFTFLYIVSSILLQWFLEIHNILWIIKNGLRLVSLGLLGLLSLKIVDIVNLIKLVGRVNSGLAIMILLALNTFYKGTKTIAELNSLVTINIPMERTGIRSKIKKIKIVGDATVMNVVDEMILTSEAYFVRQNQISRENG